MPEGKPQPNCSPLLRAPRGIDRNSHIIARRFGLRHQNVLHQRRVGHEGTLTHGIIECFSLEFIASTECRDFPIPQMGYGIHHVRFASRHIL
jgi:hypothetical protein